MSEWSIPTAIEQIEECAFECEAGPLTNNAAYRWLKDALARGPKFWPGQQVWYEVTAEAAGKKLTQWVCFTVVGCRMDSGTERTFWTYSLSYDPPAPYHYGTTHFSGVSESALRLEKPETVNG